MICPKCDFEQPDGMQECIRCRVIFAKIRLPADGPEEMAPLSVIPSGTAAFLSRLRELCVAIEPDEPAFFTFGRGIMLALMLFWGVRLICSPVSSGYAARIPLHLIHLPFHEAGHVIFGLLGVRFITVLGGTLGQLLVPAIIIFAFVIRRNPFGGSVGLWWLGQSFLDVAIYADDARAGQLPLLGGVTGSEVEDYHDWEVMLGKLGWLAYDHSIARLLYACGALLMILALVWGGLLVWRQARLLRAGGRLYRNHRS